MPTPLAGLGHRERTAQRILFFCAGGGVAIPDARANVFQQ
jgi:hypothetical protein